MKRFAVLFAAVVIVGALFITGALGGNGEQSKLQREASEITVCVDKSFLTAAEELLACYQKVCPESAPEIEFLPIPAEENEREIFITKTRLEIMSGAGPDAFLVSCADCGLNQSEMLFSSPESAMYSRLFYPLDDLIANSQFFKKEQLNQNVLAAGQSEQGQMILPLLYTYPVAWVGREEGDKADSLSWKSLVSSNSKSLKNAAKSAAGCYPMGFTFLFPQLTDWKRDNLLISREELSERLEEARYLQKVSPESTSASTGAWLLYYQFFNDVPQNKKLTFFPLCGEDGSITATITMFAAINANTSSEKAKAAFSFFDFMLSDELVSGEGYYLGSTYDTFTGEETRHYCGGDVYSYHIYYGTMGSNLFPVSGISVKDGLYGSFTAKPDGSMEAMEDFRGRIKNVRFYSGVDAALNRMALESIYTDESTEKVADEIYDTMLMILAES